jgi:uncharacterized protein (TIGR02145 family)
MKNYYLFIFLLSLTTISYSQNPCPGVPTVDYGGQTYNTVQIGNQCWLKENLNIGTMISGSLDQTNNSIIEKYCYNNDTANCTTYGGLYQWNEAMKYSTTQGAQGICPTGWHIPTYTEFYTLRSEVNGKGNSLKAIGQGWSSYGAAGTDSSGFSGLLAGYRDIDGTTGYLTSYAYFWNSTKYVNQQGNAGVMLLTWYTNSVWLDWNPMSWGQSIRCIKDAATDINDHSNNIPLPKSFNLFQNYPNPFNPSTTISFTLPEKSRVVLSIYNELGEKVAVLLNGEKEAGYHSIEWNASKFVSGVYFYELKTEKYQTVKKLILMK